MICRNQIILSNSEINGWKLLVDVDTGTNPKQKQVINILICNIFRKFWHWNGRWHYFSNWNTGGSQL